VNSLEIIVCGSLPQPEVELAPSAYNARAVALTTAESITVIENVTDLDNAASALTAIKSLTRSIEDSRKQVKAPVLEVSRRIDSIAKDYLMPLEDEAGRLSSMIGAHQEANRRKAEKEKEIAAHAQNEAMIEMQKKQRAAVEAGDAEAADAARAEAADKIAESQLALIAAQGPRVDNITTRSTWKFEVSDVEALYAARPDLCVIEPSSAAIRAIIKTTNGKPIPGLRIWSEASAVVRNAPVIKVEKYDY